MSHIFRSSSKPLILLAAALCGIWLVVFEWAWVSYTGGVVSNDARCFSPNREYYIVRLQTPFSFLWADSRKIEGSARLYDKSGKLLYQGSADISFESGPIWLAIDGYRYAVSFAGDASDESERWHFDLPSSPGNSAASARQHCF